jgi:hypothetical protein
LNIGPTREDSIVNGLNKSNKLSKVYLDLNSVRLEGITPVDAWGNYLLFDPKQTGDFSRVLSAGEDGQFGTDDDMSSENARQRNIEVPSEVLDERGRSRRAVEKTEAGEAAKKAGDAPAEPDAKAAPAAKDQPKAKDAAPAAPAKEKPSP